MLGQHMPDIRCLYTCSAVTDCMQSYVFVAVTADGNKVVFVHMLISIRAYELTNVVSRSKVTK